MQPPLPIQTLRKCMYLMYRKSKKRNIITVMRGGRMTEIDFEKAMQEVNGMKK